MKHNIDIRNYVLRTRLELMKQKMGLKSRDEVINKLISDSLLPRHFVNKSQINKLKRNETN